MRYSRCFPSRKDIAHGYLFGLAPLLLVAGAACAFAKPAAAQTYKVTATGTLTQVYTTGGQFNFSVAVGTPYTLSFLFNYSAPDDSSSDPTLGQYNLPSPYGATVAFGDYTFAPTNNGANRLGVYNNHAGTNEVDLTSANESTTGFSSPTTANVVFYGVSNTGFITSDAQLPLSAYNVANFNNLVFDVVTSQGAYVVGSVTSLSAQSANPVPEASTTVSLGVMLGLGGLVLVVRRRRGAAKQ